MIPILATRWRLSKTFKAKDKLQYDLMASAGYSTKTIQWNWNKEWEKGFCEAGLLYVPYCDFCRHIFPWGWHGGSFCTRRRLCRTGRSWWRRCRCRCRRWRRVDPGGTSWSHLANGLWVSSRKQLTAAFHARSRVLNWSCQKNTSLFFIPGEMKRLTALRRRNDRVWSQMTVNWLWE